MKTGKKLQVLREKLRENCKVNSMGKFQDFSLTRIRKEEKIKENSLSIISSHLKWKEKRKIKKINVECGKL